MVISFFYQPEVSKSNYTGANVDNKYFIDTTDGIIAFRFIQRPEAIDICSALSKIEGLNPCRLRIWDFTCGIDLANEDINKAANHANSIQLPQGKVAIVGSQDLTYGIFRVYIAHREDQLVKLHVFRTEQESRGWLKK